MVQVAGSTGFLVLAFIVNGSPAAILSGRRSGAVGRALMHRTAAEPVFALRARAVVT